MIINADSLLPHLREKVRPTHSDASRHVLCPSCGTRTKLNTLGDGRKKCTICGKKFRIHKVTNKNKLQQCAEILLCFCLDFSANRTTQITHHRYRLVSVYYDHFRKLLTEKNMSEEKILLLTAHAGDVEMVHDKYRCRWCKSKVHPSDLEGKAPVFGVQLEGSGDVCIDPLQDDEAALAFDSQADTLGPRKGYAGFICCGKFHRLTKNERAKDGAEQLWTWIRERARTHHGIWKRNTGFYLKELEWKYNNRSLDPDVQARKIIELMPMDFLTTWLQKVDDTTLVQTGT